ncbi:hypothetical protein C8J57DRAFT_1591956, partial [Mycena rebaudengoi]
MMTARAPSLPHAHPPSLANLPCRSSSPTPRRASVSTTALHTRALRHYLHTHAGERGAPLIIRTTIITTSRCAHSLSPAHAPLDFMPRSSILSLKQPSIPLRRKRTKKLTYAPYSRSTPARPRAPLAHPCAAAFANPRPPHRTRGDEETRTAISDGPPHMSVPVAAVQWARGGGAGGRRRLHRRRAQVARSSRATYIRTTRPYAAPALRWKFVGDVDACFPGL